MSARHAKLVRDRVPELMLAQGKQPRFERVVGEARWEHLKRKLVEESRELARAEDWRAELADVYEVVRALLSERALSWEELDALARRRREERGGFDQGVVLKGVDP